MHTVSGGDAEAVAVRGGRIAAVGSSAELGGLSAARVVELEGRTVLPGFQDAHLHPFAGGMLAIVCNLHETGSAEDCLEEIARYAAANPDREWISGDGWSMDFFPGGNPDKERLDAVVPDRPVYLENRDGHTAWVNSRALELAGITADTADPADGRIERNAAGEPSGALHEGAMWLVSTLVPPPSAAEQEQALLNAQAELHALGITAWQDAVVEPETLAAYLAVAGRGQLTMRAEGNLLVGSLTRRGADRRPPRDAGTGIARASPDPWGEDLPGRRARELHGLAPRAVRGHGQPRDVDARGRGAPAHARPARLARLPGAPAHDRRPRGSRVARRDRGGSAGERPARRTPPPRAHPADPSRRPAAVRRARRRRERTAVLGRAQPLRRRSHPPVHRRPGRLPLPVREPRPRRGTARLRERLDRLDREPAPDRRGGRHTGPASRA